MGAAVGLAVGMMVSKGTKTELVESILVGIFGSFIGAEFIANQVRAPGGGPSGFGIQIALAVVTAVAMLALLWLMRKAVGPLKQGKSKARDRH